VRARAAACGDDAVIAWVLPWDGPTCHARVSLENPRSCDGNSLGMTITRNTKYLSQIQNSNGYFMTPKWENLLGK
jgi:hypothetical protein